MLFSVGTLVLLTFVAGWAEAVVGLSSNPHQLIYVQVNHPVDI